MKSKRTREWCEDVLQLPVPPLFTRKSIFHRHLISCGAKFLNTREPTSVFMNGGKVVGVGDGGANSSMSVGLGSFIREVLGIGICVFPPYNQKLGVELRIICSKRE